MRNKVVLVSLLAVLILVVILGQAKFNSGGSVSSSNNVNASISIEEKGISDLKKGKSFDSDLLILSSKKDEITLSTIGSSVTQGIGVAQADIDKTWSYKLKTYIKSNYDTKIEYYNDGFGGYSAHDLINDGKVDEMIEQNPDVIVFETGLINGFNRQTSEEAIDDIDNIIAQIKKKLPDAILLVTTTNPIATEKTNGEGFNYEEYVNEIDKHLKDASGFYYLNVFEGYSKALKEQNLILDDTLKDGIHPNVDGYKLWFDVLKNYIEN